MEIFFGVVIGLFILVVLVVLHELGHALAAYRNGVVVEEFGIGFPPKAWGKKIKNRATKFIAKDKLLFTVNWLPLGGFVKLQGEHDMDNKKGDYGRASFWQKTKILLAGVFVNWVTAALLFTILALTGLPQIPQILPNQFTVAGDTTTIAKPVIISQVSKGTPADNAGLRAGDLVTKFAGKNVTLSSDLVNATKAHKGQQVDIVYTRGGTEHKATVTIRSDNKDGKGFLGIGTAQQIFTRSTWSAPVVGVVMTVQLTEMAVKGIGDLVANVWNGATSQLSQDTKTREAGNQDLETANQSVGGPITVLLLFANALTAGPTMLLYVTAIISLSLAVMNILPIPALDGGRWFTTALFRLLRRPLTQEIEEKIQATGFIALMGLILVVSYLDVTKLIK